MKAANLSRAQTLATQLGETRRLHQRVEEGEGLRLLLAGGDGAPSSEVILSPSYLRGIRDDVRCGLSARIVTLETELKALGVEP
jgi:glucan biosynthesis protein